MQITDAAGAAVIVGIKSGVSITMSSSRTPGRETRSSRSLVDRDYASNAARAFAGRSDVAALTRARLATLVSPLAQLGYHLVTDRAWRGSRYSPVDLIVVGPSGVYIVDTKYWPDAVVLPDRVLRGRLDVSDDLAAIADLAYGAEGALLDVGLSPNEIHAVTVIAGYAGEPGTIGPVRISGEKDVLALIGARGRRLSESQVETVLERVLDYFPALEVFTQAENVAAPEVPTDLPPVGTLISDTELQAALKAANARASIRSWMTFLDIEPAKLVRKTFSGPARIRGASGTGKSAVGLQRAAYLARARSGRVLVTTYVSTLPAVMATLMSRLAPEVSGQIDFFGTHAFAKKVLVERGIDINVQPQVADVVFDTVWRTVGAPGALGRLDSNSRYWKEELHNVIKGRGLTRFEEYAEVARAGRRRSLTNDQRRWVWELYRAYEAGLAERGVNDFPDLVNRAERSLSEEPLERYLSVIIDEAQDMSPMMIRMLHHLVGDQQDGLLLIGDGQQTIYPGAYTMAEAGVSVEGRTVLLQKNHRSTSEILTFAATMVVGDRFTDIDGVDEIGDAQRSARHGARPTITDFPTRTKHDAALVARIRKVMADTDVKFGEIGVLAMDNYGVGGAVRALQQAGIPTMELNDYNGRPNNAVKVGTIKRSKGIEFKQILLVRVNSLLLEPSPTPPLVDAAYERWELQRRELYVAMTRAREGLWVGSIA